MICYITSAICQTSLHTWICLSNILFHCQCVCLSWFHTVFLTLIWDRSFLPNITYNQLLLAIFGLEGHRTPFFYTLLYKVNILCTSLTVSAQVMAKTPTSGSHSMCVCVCAGLPLKEGAFPPLSLSDSLQPGIRMHCLELKQPSRNMPWPWERILHTNEQQDRRTLGLETVEHPSSSVRPSSSVFYEWEISCLVQALAIWILLLAARPNPK